jgi:hypothetical protein
MTIIAVEIARVLPAAKAAAPITAKIPGSRRDASIHSESFAM